MNPLLSELLFVVVPRERGEAKGQTTDDFPVFPRPFLRVDLNLLDFVSAFVFFLLSFAP